LILGGIISGFASKIKLIRKKVVGQFEVWQAAEKLFL